MSEATKFGGVGDAIPVGQEQLEGSARGRNRSNSEDVADQIMVNDSLGTVDPSDSTGTDPDKEVEAEEAEHDMEERHN